MEPLVGAEAEARRRLARMRLEGLGDYELAVRHAESLRLANAPDLASLSGILDEISRRRTALKALAGGRLQPRWRPKQTFGRWAEHRPVAHVFIDETGLTKGTDPHFPFFATAAVIVADRDMTAVGDAIHSWQQRWWGTPRYVHELDVRKGTGSFHFSGDEAQRKRALTEYFHLLSHLPYAVVAVVIDKLALAELHPDGVIDGYLPAQSYPLAVQMLFERVAHCLYSMDDSIGLVEAEGIGEKEDALLQQAYSDLRLRGTRYLSERWFRYQLREYIAFYGKVHNRPGLQLADWIVKPCADAVAFSNKRTSQHHAGWEHVFAHLYGGGQDRPDKFGLKVYPSQQLVNRELLFPDIPVERDVDWDPEKLKGPQLAG